MKNKRLLIWACISLWIGIPLFGQQVSDYNVVWNTPSEDSGGSMPLGNGELGMNVWVEKGGDLFFYLSRTDAISEANRLMKLGRIRLHLQPNPFEDGQPFCQQLLLGDGVIEVKAGPESQQTTIRLYMDPEHPVSYLTIDSKEKIQATVTAESWRKEPHLITQAESVSAWTTQPLPDGLELRESADRFLPDKNNITWCHANESSVYHLTMRHQQKESLSENFPDPISNRIFGASISGKGFRKMNDSVFATPGKVNRATLQIATHSKQSPSVEAWKKEVQAIGSRSSATKALEKSRNWWSGFWKRHYIYVDIPADKAFGHQLTQSYILQRYMAAGSGRGNFPIKFNGSIFTVDPVHTNGATLTPDFRNWGNEFWWQNTRLPYYAMLPAGDFDLMQPLFDFYLSRMNAFRTLASTYYGAKGILIPETVTIFGTYANGDWGWDRTGVTPKDVLTPYLRYIWVQGLELSKLLLDYYFYTGDTAFLQQKALPTIKEVVLYFDSRFIGENGKMRISPSQSLESYWFDVVNDMPSVAGLHYLTSQLTALPDGVLSSEDKAYYQRIAASLPPLPCKQTVQGAVFMPAEEYLDKRSNIENPELYPVFPFCIAHQFNDLKETAVLSFERRVNDLSIGWGQDGQLAAMLGLKDVAVANLHVKVNNTNKNQRFTAMWGPNYDWVPDQDHGSNLLMTLQYMLMQSYEGKTYLLPTWPADWNVSFRMAAPGQTMVEGVYKDGKLDFHKEGDTEILTGK